MEEDKKLFKFFTSNILNIDPVYWIENNLTLDGKPFRLNGNGFKPFADIYRYIGLKSLEPNSKPVVIVKGRQVGATTMAAALELYFMCCGLYGKNNKPPIRLAHCFPQLELAFRYTKTKLNVMVSSAVPGHDPEKPNKKVSVIEALLDTSVPSNDSLQYKQFKGGNHLFIESLGVTGDRLRGMTIDGIMCDEVQDMRWQAIGQSLKILTASQYGARGSGIQVYFGTPKQKGSDYWKLWNSSTQQYYYLGCEKCNEFFQLYTPGTNEWEKIWIEKFVVKCTHCGHEQDKIAAAERGKWIASNPDAPYIGYHINQLYIPYFSKEKVLSEKPENNPINTERIYQNEVLGEFYSGDASPLTPDDIDKNCADYQRKFSASILPSEERKIYLGCDWGLKADLEQLSEGESSTLKSQGKSYSCAVVLSVDGPNKLSIQYATRLKRNNLEEKKKIVEEMFRKYSINLAVGDIGYANDLTELLQKEYGPRFLASQSASQVNGKARFKEDFFPHTILFEKDYHIEELISWIKKGWIRFPYGDFEKIGWLIDHCCSMELKPKIDRSGDVGTMYKKGPTPNDGFMALLNAFLAYKYEITNGFKISNPNNMCVPTVSKQIPAIAAYIPGLNPWKKK